MAELMRAWIKHDGRLQLAEVPRPVPGTNELLIRVKATSLNRGEVRAAARAPQGTIPGWDVAGVVVQSTADGRPPVDTRVSTFVRSGAWAEFVCAPAKQVATVPTAVELDVAATLPIAGLTAVRAFQLGGSLLGKRVMITGGSGGVGQFAIQLGAQAGAMVTAVSSRDSQRESLRRLGAREVVRTIEDGQGPYDLILESVGGDSLAVAIDRVARGGTVVTIGNSSEQDTTFNARTLYSKGGATIYGLLIFEEVESCRVGARDLETLLSFVEEGTLISPIACRRTWTDLPAALDELDHGGYAGKAVLTHD